MTCSHLANWPLGQNVTGHQDMMMALLNDSCRVAITDLEAALRAVAASGLKSSSLPTPPCSRSRTRIQPRPTPSASRNGDHATGAGPVLLPEVTRHGAHWS
jgi:hypothetical protein